MNQKRPRLKSSSSSSGEKTVRVVILGAGGRDFHNFNMFFRPRPSYEVVAFTASQIPFIAHRVYPPELAGPRYPRGIPIYPEEDLPRLLSELHVDQVVFSYSDVSHEEVMHKASLILASGQDFVLLGPRETMIQSKVPVISICAVRTGCGKSVITRKVASLLKDKNIGVSVIRHPMAYCTFDPVVRFSDMYDVESKACTIEEKEEFEPLVQMGVTVYAGVDYAKVVRASEKGSQVILWDGGNNDLPFVKSDGEIVLLDALRPGHEIFYYPGEVNLKRADLLIITKVNQGNKDSLIQIKRNILRSNPGARVMEASTILRLDQPELIRGKRVLVVEDGPTITHGGMADGAGAAAALPVARELIDPRPYAVGSLREVYEKHPHIGKVLPAMGYSKDQTNDLQETIRKSKADAVVIATPMDLSKEVNIDLPFVRVQYDFEVDLGPWLEEWIDKKLRFP